MSSPYLGWKEHKPAREFDTSRVDREVLPGGPITASYENYVRNIFRPNRNVGVGINGVPPGGGEIATRGFSVDVGDVKTKMSATAMLKIEEQLGADALDDSREQLGARLI